MADDATAVSRHYGRPDLTSQILGALRAAGKDTNALTRDDLGAFDEIHLRGRAATRELAALAALSEGAQVLDVGCGVGGPARTYAAEFGLRVTGIDLTEEFVRAAEALTAAARIEPRPTFRVADATAIPFADASFDGVFIQHVSMNIRDKPRLFREVHRVLRPGGKLALFEICAGPAGGALHYPVVWASASTTNFLVGATQLRREVADAGFREDSWEDQSAACIAWSHELAAQAKAAQAPPPVGPQLILGPDLPAKRANTLKNLEEQRTAVVRGRFTRA